VIHTEENHSFQQINVQDLDLTLQAHPAAPLEARDRNVAISGWVGSHRSSSAVSGGITSALLTQILSIYFSSQE